MFRVRIARSLRSHRWGLGVGGLARCARIAFGAQQVRAGALFAVRSAFLCRIARLGCKELAGLTRSLCECREVRLYGVEAFVEVLAVV